MLRYTVRQLAYMALTLVGVSFAVFVLMAESNAVNLTDGLDGLAIGPVIICSFTLLLFAYGAGTTLRNFNIADYLGMPHVPGAGELAVFCGAMGGAGIVFVDATHEVVDSRAFALLPAMGWLMGVASRMRAGRRWLLRQLCPPGSPASLRTLTERRLAEHAPALAGRAVGLVLGWQAARINDDLQRFRAVWEGFADQRAFWR